MITVVTHILFKNESFLLSISASAKPIEILTNGKLKCIFKRLIMKFFLALNYAQVFS